MEWITVADAAVRLGKSTRTVQRMAAKADLESRTDGTRMLIAWPDDTPDPVVVAADNLTRAATAGAIERARTSDILAAAVATLDAVRVSHVGEVRRARRWSIAAVATAAIVSLAAAIGAVMATSRLTESRFLVDDSVRRMSRANDRAASAVQDVADGRDVILTLERRIATSDGIASARSDELTRAAERLAAVSRDRDDAQVNLEIARYGPAIPTLIARP